MTCSLCPGIHLLADKVWDASEQGLHWEDSVIPRPHQICVANLTFYDWGPHSRALGRNCVALKWQSVTVQRKTQTFIQNSGPIVQHEGCS